MRSLEGWSNPSLREWHGSPKENKCTHTDRHIEAHAWTHTKDCLWLTLYLGYYHYYCFVFSSLTPSFTTVCWSAPYCAGMLICTCRWGELQQDAVAAQCDDERLLPHAAALCLPGNWTLEHTGLLSWKKKRKRRWEDLGKIEINIYTAWENMPKDDFLVETFDNGLPLTACGCLGGNIGFKGNENTWFYSAICLKTNENGILNWTHTFHLVL